MDFKQKQTTKQIEFNKNRLHMDEKDISLTKILGSEQCQVIIANCREYRERIYSPFKTLLTFTKQVMSPDKSCKNIVGERIAKELAEGKALPSNNTGPYSKARDRLPESTIQKLVIEIGTSTRKSPARGFRDWRNQS